MNSSVTYPLHEALDLCPEWGAVLQTETMWVRVIPKLGWQVAMRAGEHMVLLSARHARPAYSSFSVMPTRLIMDGDRISQYLLRHNQLKRLSSNMLVCIDSRTSSSRGWLLRVQTVQHQRPSSIHGDHFNHLIIRGSGIGLRASSPARVVPEEWAAVRAYCLDTGPTILLERLG